MEELFSNEILTINKQLTQQCSCSANSYRLPYLAISTWEVGRKAPTCHLSITAVKFFPLAVNPERYDSFTNL